MKTKLRLMELMIARNPRSITSVLEVMLPEGHDRQAIYDAAAEMGVRETFIGKGRHKMRAWGL